MDLKRKKYIYIILICMIATMFIIMLCGDFFTHGFFCAAKDYSFYKEQGDIEYIDLSETTYRTEFSPTKNHFAGFEIIMSNIASDVGGEVQVSIRDQDNNLYETIVIDISEVENDNWYIVKTKKDYKKGNIYAIFFDAKNCDIAPRLQLVDKDYLSEDNLGNDLLIFYGYAESTFSDAEKLFLSLLTIGGLIFIYGEYIVGERKKKVYRYLSVGLILTVALSWNYMFNSFDQENSKDFYEFQDDSDSLVMNVIIAENNRVFLGEYGLGTYYSLDGQYSPRWKKDFYSDEDWEEGYSINTPQILIEDNDGTKIVIDNAVAVRFSNGDMFDIVSKWGNGKVCAMTVDSTSPLSRYKYGRLDEAIFYDENGCELSYGYLKPYKSQYGLQGRVFRHLARMVPAEKTEEYLWLMCVIPLGIVLTLISFLIYKKYNLLMAACFWFTFLLSPWIVNFSNSVYWVEVTWFLPMLIGLICAIWINNKIVRLGCYISCFLTIFIKSLCGYEYVTAVMLGMIAFLLVDFILSIVNRNKKDIILYFRTIFIVGLIAVFAFATAICIHASLRGDGNILLGIKSIFDEDVLRRVAGGSMNDFDEYLWPSLNASTWEVFTTYFHFNTDIIAGIDANCFPLMTFLPLVFFVYSAYKGRLEKENCIMYVVFFGTSVSWIVLSKSHSYVHTHMNYVMWYMGFVQVCIYNIIYAIKNVLSIEKGYKNVE